MGEVVERYGGPELGLEFVDDGQRAAVVVTDPIKKSMEAFTFPSRVLIGAWSKARKAREAMEENREAQVHCAEAAERRFKNIVAVLETKVLTPVEREVMRQALNGLSEVQIKEDAAVQPVEVDTMSPEYRERHIGKGEPVEHDIRSLGHELRVLAGKYKEIQGPASPVAEKLIAISLGEDKD